MKHDQGFRENILGQIGEGGEGAKFRLANSESWNPKYSELAKLIPIQVERK